MVVLGVDAHKRNHTVDELGRKLGQHTCGTTSEDHFKLMLWAEQFGPDRQWAVEDCRHLSRRLERDLLSAGERILRVPPKLMAHARDAARSYGKSDPIDALAVARAALREPDLPAAQLDGPAREVRLLTDHRDDLVAERTRTINRPPWISSRAAGCSPSRSPRWNVSLSRSSSNSRPRCSPSKGCATLTAAKILGETADIRRFRSRHAYARHNGTAPLPVWSANRERRRLSRTGNRQLNAAIHRIAITQAHYHPDARDYLQRRRTNGDSTTESIRALKRRLSDIVYRALLTDAKDSNINMAA
ncbi:hypothetical protein B0E53_00085 [Micromonospora sp. MH33]|uniref:IS110 family transposase n=1 Tax=Micromonospora sp. MH33 TaxID=1945509 RepID=UPI000D148D1C|nr:transposase [Micromonospora sp. MH33]PSK68010.1 hypothetical protein B0E53_00085 [Micromonospora sp. MH33]